ncbi:Ig-like domain-containing protein [Prescottella agglutinans]|uniref:Plastocyanin n=1 Tax=Prescottella agglutinans TaxID=1644129 RepID=A0ABT6MD12_9NOCA|nr:Ig-like domain-containing protein [Prescottella agglutinans]MDH6282210.1 plastocyanin [Prescottella agglutinans]
MVRTITRRVASAVVAGAMTVSVAAVGQALWGAGTAAADPISQTVTTDNIVATKKVEPAVAHPGETVTTTITFKTNGGVDRYLEYLVDYPPAGYVLQNVTGNVWRSASGNLNNPSLFDGQAVQSSADGAVSLKWTDATFALGLIPGQGLLNKTPELTFTYKVADDAQPGPRSTGMAFKPYAFTRQDFNPMTGLAVKVDPRATTTTVSAPATAVTGTPVTLSATVAPSSATGAVQFKDNGVNVGAPVQVASGYATTSYTFPSAGPHSVTAVFTATSNFASSTSEPQTVSVTAPDVATSTALTVPTDAKTGASVQLTAAVTPANATGTVQFRDNGADIGAPVPVSGGGASLQHTFTATGTHNIVAVFNAGSGFVGSTSPVRSVVVTDPAPGDVATTTTLTAPANATVGKQVQLSAQVAGAATLPGTVQFYDGTTAIGTPQPLVGGAATLTYTFTTAGTHEVVAVYSGGSGFTGSSSAPQSVQVTNRDGGAGTGSAGSLGGVLPLFGS